MKEFSKRVLIIAGEASGDLHASYLVKSVRRLNPSVHFVGIGSQRMKQVGVECFMDSKDIAVMGLIEARKQLKCLMSARQKVRSIIKRHLIDLVILIDFGGFNLRVAKLAKKHGIPVLYYISPQIWASRKYRILAIKARVDHMAVIFPFELGIYQRHHVPVTYVGHPLVEHMQNSQCKNEREARQLLNIHPDHLTITLMPGSRINEIEYLLPSLLKASEYLKQRYPECQFLLGLAPTVTQQDIEPYLEDCRSIEVCVTDRTYMAIQAADVVMVASGTATLEVALFEKPMVIVYKLSKLAYCIARRLVRVAHIGLCNILADKRLCPELIQGDVTPEKIAEQVVRFVDDSDYYSKTQRSLANIRRQLGDGHASRQVAQIVLSMLSGGVG